ncbi:unnamed protein product [Ectocarpus sp. CCAP 1310/34]|nr:unnamed protein product [Ectocarpus sp. CCAP 1310/34]
MSPLAGKREQAAREPVFAGEGPKFKDVREGGQCEPLFEAVSDEQEQIVADLLAAGACPNARFGGEEGYAPLHVASSRGHVGILTTLLSFGAHRDAVDNRGARPLHHAIAEDRVAATEALLVAGALGATPEDSSSFRPLVLAACKGSIDIINVLLKHGVDVNSRDDVVGATALHAAANCASGASAVHALVDAGAEINVQRKDGGSPLHYAAASRASSSPSSPFETILALLQRGASVNQVHSGTAQTPLLLACQHRPRGLGSVVDLLLRWGGDDTVVGGDGRTASELLELDQHHHATETEHHQCHLEQDDEIGRARTLLSRAKEDRAWRRRCLPVMLRAHQQRVCTAPSGDIEARRRGGRDHGDLEAGQMEGSKRIDIGGAPGAANEIEESNGTATADLVDNSGVEGESQSLACVGGSDRLDEKDRWTRVVDKLVRLTVEDVFRTIVGFI